MAERGDIAFTLVGGPTLCFEYGGLRFVTDPTFDPPGEYPIGQRVLTKTVGAAVTPEALGPIDAVLLSHQQHPDNLDRSGRAFLVAAAPVTLTTPASAEAIGGSARGLRPWERATIGSGNTTVTVTAVPARHGPPGCEPLTGEVTGFVLTAESLPSLYVSGDNAALEIVAEIAERARPIGVAVLFAGGAKTALLGDAFLTLSSTMAAEAARILGSELVVPAHFSGWGHFTEGADDLRRAFEAAGLSRRMVLLDHGASARFDPIALVARET